MLLPVKPHGNSEKLRNVHRFTPFGSGTQILPSRAKAHSFSTPSIPAYLLAELLTKISEAFPRIPPQEATPTPGISGDGFRRLSFEVPYLQNLPTKQLICYLFPHTSSVVFDK